VTTSKNTPGNSIDLKKHLTPGKMYVWKEANLFKMDGATWVIYSEFDTTKVNLPGSGNRGLGGIECATFHPDEPFLLVEVWESSVGVVSFTKLYSHQIVYMKILVDGSMGWFWVIPDFTPECSFVEFTPETAPQETKLPSSKKKKK
jgi:hypothetical protein